MRATIGIAAVAIVALAGAARGQDPLGTWTVTGEVGGAELEAALVLSGSATTPGAALQGKLGGRDVALVGSARVTRSGGGAPAAGGRAVVTASSLNIRSLPFTDAPIVTTVPRGTSLDVVAVDKGWTRVRRTGDAVPRFAWTGGLEAEAGPASALEVGLVESPGLAGALALDDETPHPALCLRLVRSAEHRLDGSAVRGTEGGSVTLERPAPAIAPGRVRFVLAGTSLPIANATVTLVLDGAQSRRLDLPTDARGETALPEGLPAEGTWRASFGRRVASATELARRPADRATAVAAPDLASGKTVGLAWRGPTLEDLYARIDKASWETGSGRFAWNAAKHDWEIGKLDCITSSLFAVSYATDLGARGAFAPVNTYNMIRLKDGRPFVANTCYRPLLSLAFGSEATLAELAHAGSVYRGVCRLPWNDLPWDWTKTSACGCGLHVTPKTIKDALPGLGELNVLSMTQVKKYSDRPMKDWSLKYEYSVLVLYRRPSDGRVFTCHSGSWRTFEAEADDWGMDSHGSAVTGVRYIVWKLAAGQVEPWFWLDAKGRPYTPPEVATATGP